MKTEHMIAAFVADAQIVGKSPARQSLNRQLIYAIAPVAALVAILFYGVYGLRDDLTDAFAQIHFVFKLGFFVVLSCVLARALLDVARPLPLPRFDLVAMAGAAFVFLMALGFELVTVPSSAWHARLVGDNAAFCLIAIPALGLPILVMALLALRAAAPRNGAFAGGVAGVFAGALAGTLYAMHCPDDSPLFVATWYGLATGCMAVLGAIVGRYILRW